MKSKKLLIVAIMVAVLSLILVGCNNDGLQYDKEYSQVFYDREEGKFVKSGTSISISEDYKYVENYAVSNDNKKTLQGNYIVDNELNLLYLEANIASLDKFKRDYKSELKKMGYTASEIDNILLPPITGKGEMYMYKDYMFKLGSINASREGDPATVSQLDGIYNFSGIMDKKNDQMKLDLGIIYGKKITESGDVVFEDKIGEYEISGDFITIKPTVALGGGKISKPMRYLLADIVLPVSYEENIDKDNRYEGNKVIKYYENVKIKVIVGSFYTTKTVK